MARRIVIADDHPMFRDALRLAIEGKVPDADIVEAGSLDRVVAGLEGAPETDLVLLDLNMPGMQGFSGLAYLCAAFPGVPVAVVSANEEPRVIRRALAVGASGYIPKSARSQDMRVALGALLAGEVWVPEGSGLDAAGPEDPDAATAARFASLTPQQMRVLMMLNDGLVNKQIAYELDVSEGTVKAHVSAILQKLSVTSRTQAVILARQLAAEANAPQEAIRRAASGD